MSEIEEKRTAIRLVCEQCYGDDCLHIRDGTLCPLNESEDGCYTGLYDQQIIEHWEVMRDKGLFTNPVPTKPEAVNHPSHYNSGKIECIDAMVESQGIEATKHFCICNAFKYIWRADKKNGLEDIDKAIWYLNKYKELSDGKTNL